MWSDIDAWKLAFILALGMCIGAGLGWCQGQMLRRKDHDVSETTLEGAVLSLLGLLLAFTFSMALMKHEGRREAAVADSNAIGDFSSCVGLLDDPLKSRLNDLVRRYVEVRLSMADPATEREEFQHRLSETQTMQSEMHVVVADAARKGTPVIVPLVTTYNGLTSAHASRLAAVRDRLPPHVLLLLAVTAILAVALAGKRAGIEGKRRLGPMASFIAIVCLVVWVTLDLDQPRRGWITVSQEPMQQLLQTLKR